MTFHPKIIIEELNQIRFSTYRELEDAVADRFYAHLSHFPPGVTHRHFIRWAIQERLIEDTGAEFVVKETAK